MNCDEVIDRLRRSEDDLHRLGMRSLRLFGSVARGEAAEESDVDLLVEFDGPATFSGFMTPDTGRLRGRSSAAAR